MYRAKGVPQRHAEEFFNTNKAKYERPNKLREVLRRNLSPKRTFKLIPNYWETHEKEIRSQYTKRTVLNSGETIPLIMKLGDGNNGKNKAKKSQRSKGETL